jgi:acyl dehydratase
MQPSTYISLRESKRFGMNVLRVNAATLNYKEISKLIFDNEIDLTILRIPTENIGQLQQLNKLGCTYIQADTLVYYFANLNKIEISPLQNANIQFVLATKNDTTILQSLVEKIFANYSNHYNTNLYLNKQDIVEGYKEWVIDFLDVIDKFVFIVYKNNKPIGFATCAIENAEAEGVLYGVLPSEKGGGIYTDIIRYTQYFFKSKGVQTMKVSTQINNYAVQKVWSKEGFVLTQSYATVHINSFLKYTLQPPQTVEVIFTKEEIGEYANLSGDFNPLHTDELFANEMGFKDTIAHGLIANMVTSKYFGTVFPGAGTLFLSYNYSFLRPLYANTNYKAIFTIPYHNKEKSIYLGVVKIIDSDNQLCLIAYNNLLKK